MLFSIGHYRFFHTPTQFSGFSTEIIPPTNPKKQPLGMQKPFAARRGVSLERGSFLEEKQKKLLRDVLDYSFDCTQVWLRAGDGWVKPLLRAAGRPGVKNPCARSSAQGLSGYFVFFFLMILLARRPAFFPE